LNASCAGSKVSGKSLSSSSFRRRSTFMPLGPTSVRISLAVSIPGKYLSKNSVRSSLLKLSRPATRRHSQCEYIERLLLLPGEALALRRWGGRGRAGRARKSKRIGIG
jgi:hypothetical protein